MVFLGCDPLSHSPCMALALLLFALHRLSFLLLHRICASDARISGICSRVAKRRRYAKEAHHFLTAPLPPPPPPPRRRPGREGCRRVVVDSSDTIEALVVGYFTEGRDLTRERGLPREKTLCVCDRRWRSDFSFGFFDCKSLDLRNSSVLDYRSLSILVL